MLKQRERQKHDGRRRTLGQQRMRCGKELLGWSDGGWGGESGRQRAGAEVAECEGRRGTGEGMCVYQEEQTQDGKAVISGNSRLQCATPGAAGQRQVRRAAASIPQREHDNCQ